MGEMSENERFYTCGLGSLNIFISGLRIKQTKDQLNIPLLVFHFLFCRFVRP